MQIRQVSVWHYWLWRLDYLKCVFIQNVLFLKKNIVNALLMLYNVFMIIIITLIVSHFVTVEKNIITDKHVCL